MKVLGLSVIAALVLTSCSSDNSGELDEGAREDGGAQLDAVADQRVDSVATADGAPDRGKELCGNGRCDLEETAGSCSEDCYPENLPYSVLAIHEETWGGFETMVALADRYNTPLTILFWPGIVRHILADPSRIELVRTWQRNGHEIGIHNQGCQQEDEKAAMLGPQHTALYEQLAAPHKVKSGTSPCQYHLPDDYRYNIGLGRMDGRTSVALEADNVDGKTLLLIAGKPNYFDNPQRCGGTQVKIDQYMTLEPDEVFGFITHTLEVMGCDGVPEKLKSQDECERMVDAFGGASTEPFETWLKFLHAKDPEGRRRKTLSDLMEQYMIPQDRVIRLEDICDKNDDKLNDCLPILEDSDPRSRMGGVSTKDFKDTCFPIGCFDKCDTSLFDFGRCLEGKKDCRTDAEWSLPIGYCPREC